MTEELVVALAKAAMQYGPGAVKALRALFKKGATPADQKALNTVLANLKKDPNSYYGDAAPAPAAPAPPVVTPPVVAPPVVTPPVTPPPLPAALGQVRKAPILSDAALKAEGFEAGHVIHEYDNPMNGTVGDWLVQREGVMANPGMRRVRAIG